MVLTNEQKNLQRQQDLQKHLYDYNKIGMNKQICTVKTSELNRSEPKRIENAEKNFFYHFFKFSNRIRINSLLSNGK